MKKLLYKIINSLKQEQNFFLIKINLTEKYRHSYSSYAYQTHRHPVSKVKYNDTYRFLIDVEKKCMPYVTALSKGNIIIDFSVHIYTRNCIDVVFKESFEDVMIIINY